MDTLSCGRLMRLVPGVNQAQFKAVEAGQYLIAADDPVAILDFKNGRNPL